MVFGRRCGGADDSFCSALHSRHTFTDLYRPDRHSGNRAFNQNLCDEPPVRRIWIDEGTGKKTAAILCQINKQECFY